MTPLVAPSLLAADFGHLADQLALIEPASDWLHLDVMDGVFVPNISFGFPILEAIARLWHKPLDLHLMITDPARYTARFAALGIQTMTVHIEATPDLPGTLTAIRAAGIKAGVALSPGTPVSALAELVPALDMILIMAVQPGFGGQPFLPSSYEKIREARRLITRTGSPALIEVDGGVTFDNAPHLLQAGADVLVAGNTVFGNPDPVRSIRTLKGI
jgi:ribulose-phosphate 3-epimerase